MSQPTVRYMSELIDALEANVPGSLATLERMLAVTGPLAYRGKAYGLADPRPFATLVVLGPLRRAEMVSVPVLTPRDEIHVRTFLV